MNMPIEDTKIMTSKGVRMMMDSTIAKAKGLRIAATIAIVNAGGHW